MMKVGQQESPRRVTRMQAQFETRNAPTNAMHAKPANLGTHYSKSFQPYMGVWGKQWSDGG
jgi:hypothetical protein